MKNLLREHHLHTTLSAWLTLALIMPFVMQATTASGLVSIFYKFSIPAYYAIFIYILSLALIPLAVLKINMYLRALLFSLWAYYLLIDLVVFNIYQFHINSLLINMFFADLGGMGIPTSIILMAIAVFAGLFFSYVFLIKILKNWQWKKAYWLTLALCFPIFIANQFIHIWGSRYDQQAITQYTPAFPLFYPTTSRNFATKLSNALPYIFPASNIAAKNIQKKNHSNNLHYPLNPLTCSTTQHPSVLLFVLESWQADSLKTNVMPNIASFAKQATEFKQHIASGSSTVPGLFGVLYGIHPTYYENFRANASKNPSLLIKTFAEAGYTNQVFTSSNLNRFSLRTLFFPNIATDHYHEFLKNDAKTMESYLTNLDKPERQQQPHFDFVFLTSSHFNYEYPSEFGIFKPLPTRDGGYLIDKQTDPSPYKNDYYNSLYYLDNFFGKVIEKLRRDNRLDNTWIIITGDHGEEFNETQKGYWGHGSNYTRWQTQTPLIIWTGKSASQIETRTSAHQDIAPTLMQNVLGCTNPIEDYSNGFNAFALPEKRNTVISSYFTSAYWVDGVILEKSTMKKPYSWKDFSPVENTPDFQAINQLMKEESHFLK